MQDLIVYKDSRLDLQITQDETDSVSMTMALKDTSDNTYEFTVAFVDGVADFQSEVGIPTLPVGVYEYMLYENFDTGLPIAYPDPSNCEGDCVLPTLTICESIEVS